MSEVATYEILEELKFVKDKVIEMDKELHNLREDFADTHLTGEETKLLAKALGDEQRGKTISLVGIKKRLNLR